MTHPPANPKGPTMTNPLGSICSGMAGLELGIARVIPTRTMWVADYEPPKKGRPQKQSAAKVLDHRFPGVPNLGDITIVNWSTTTPVKIVCGGTPCQDVSVAGTLAGMRGGTRSGIWASMVEAINHHRPTLVIWENVRGALSAGADSNVEPCPICVGDDDPTHLRALGRVLGDLAELGYDAAWVVLRASDVDAPHERARVFVAAWPATDPDRDQVRQQPVERAQRSSAAIPGHLGAATDADPTDVGHERGRPPRGRRNGPPDHRDHAPDPQGDGRDEGRTEPAGQFRGPDASQPGDIDWGPFAGVVHRWERILGRPAPAPTVLSTRGNPQLSPRFVEFMMGLDDGWVTGVPDLTRNEMLHVLGNGVVPQQAAAAVEFLLGHAPAWVRADLGLPPA
jgi:DNA (cytosine-5)-methyltransferase 1